MMPKSSAFYPNLSLNLHGKIMDFSTTKVMGIINATPDSFFKNSRSDQSNIERISRKMVDDGVDIFDVGGQSSRPGAETISSKYVL